MIDNSDIGITRNELYLQNRNRIDYQRPSINQQYCAKQSHAQFNPSLFENGRILKSLTEILYHEFVVRFHSGSLLDRFLTGAGAYINHANAFVNQNSRTTYR